MNLLADLERTIRRAEELRRRTTVVESWYVDRDHVYVFEGQPIVHPSVMMRLRNNGRVPFWSQYTRGDREVQRDRRRHGAAPQRGGK